MAADALLYTQLFSRVDRPRDPRHPLPEREGSARLSVEVPAALKDRVEASAAVEGIATDAWIVRALSRSLDPRLVTL